MATPTGAVADLGDLAIKPPDTVVIPPKGVRENLHKTADFIFRRPGMEANLRDRVAQNPEGNKFSYLNRDDVYNAYFAWYLEQLREGKGPVAGGAQAAPDNKPKGPPEPAKFRFSARMPNISAKDLEVVKLTALYCARNGENWLKELRNREAGNAQFDFLRANHSFFQFFRATVEQYKILLEEQATVDARIEELRLNVKDRFHVLRRAKERMEYVKYISAQKEKEEKKAEEEKKEYASIDWNDFAIIATVTFDEADDAVDLPPPETLNDLQSRSLEQKAEVSRSMRLEEAMPDDQTYYNVSHTPAPTAYPGYPSYSPAAATPFAPPVQPVYQPTPPPFHDHPIALPPAPQSEQAEREKAAQLQAAARSAPGMMRIRNDYVPRAAAKKGSVATAMCPNCKQQIPVNELDEHIRIELLDPRWKEQREKAESRYSTTMNTVDVANNLKRFASMRDDIYDGVTGMPISEEEAARRKKAALSYDGQPDPAKDAARIQEMQSMNVQEQLRRIQERHGK